MRLGLKMDKEITECIHAHHVETNPYSHDTELMFIPVCNQCYIDYEIEGIEVYSFRGRGKGGLGQTNG